MGRLRRDCTEPGTQHGQAPAGLEPSPTPRPASPSSAGRGDSRGTAEQGRAPALHKKAQQAQGAVTLSAEPRAALAELQQRAMEQYFSATQKMEQEVMFPSLLRGVFPQQEGAAPAAESRTDLYERYQLLKAIKPMVEKGLASVGEQSPAGADSDAALGEGADSNLEERLSHHVNGLQQVLTDLTKNTKALTRRYSQILEEIHLSEDQSSS
ncbi:uncharacterized protein LOC130259117 [Oenanthe melanoleuca]|nr:uncharacterized protein LOC130259117 [Oenanthe melanoleuca]